MTKQGLTYTDALRWLAKKYNIVIPDDAHDEWSDRLNNRLEDMIMNSDSGFGANGSPFEYAVAEGKSRTLTLKKVALVAAYVLWALVFFLVGSMTRLLVPMIALVPITVWIFVYLTWKYTQVEYEYSFFAGKLTVSRVLGNRTRKKITELALRDLSSVLPYTERNVAQAESYGAKNSYLAASSTEAKDLYILLWQDPETAEKKVLCMELNEKAIKIIKYYNMSAMAK
jgi:hypothetical protein